MHATARDRTGPRRNPRISLAASSRDVLELASCDVIEATVRSRPRLLWAWSVVRSDAKRVLVHRQVILDELGEASTTHGRRGRGGGVREAR